MMQALLQKTEMESTKFMTQSSSFGMMKMESCISMILRYKKYRCGQVSAQ